MRMSLKMVALVSLMGMVTASAKGQCPPRLLEGSGAPGLYPNPTAAAMWDPDGPGPQSPVLVVGRADVAGSAATGGIAMWDGTAWTPLASSDLTVGLVGALAVHNGDLYAGGVFRRSGSGATHHVIRWTGSDWEPVGTQLSYTIPSQERVYGMVSHEGLLVVGGTFLNLPQVGGGFAAAQRVIAWDGAEWQLLGNPTQDWTWNRVDGMFEFNGDLYGHGWFRGPLGVREFGRWNGVSWEPAFDGLEAEPADVCVHNAKLYACGQNLVRPTGSEPWACVARWTGSAWEGLPPLETNARVATLVSHEGRLAIIGDFDRDDKFPPTILNNVAVLDGNQWAPLGQGLAALNIGSASTLVSYQQDLFVFGRVDRLGSVPALGGARFVAGTWMPLADPDVGLNGLVSAMVELGGAVYAGGEFTVADGVAVNNVAAWDGRVWSPVSGGLPVGGPIRALTVSGGRLTTAGDSGVFSWLGAGGGWVQLFDPFPSATIFRFERASAATDWSGSPVIGGTALRPGASASTRLVARWLGDAWELLGGDFNDALNDLCVFRGELYAAGNFSSIGGQPAAALARWDGTAWQPVIDSHLVSGSFPRINDLDVHDDRLILSGSLFLSSTNRSAATAAWDGANLVALGEGRCCGVGVIGGALYATSAYTDPTRTTIIAPARWDGTGWVEVAPGFTTTNGSTIIGHNGEVLIGGTNSGGGGVTSAFFARFTHTAIPWISLHPIDTGVTNQAVATLSAAPAIGYDFDGPLTYQWRRDGVPIANGPAGASTGGGTVSGASGTLSGDQIATLTIDAVAFSDAGSYDIVVANACGTATSNPARLVVTPGVCPPDLTGTALVGAPGYGLPNGVLNTDDFFYYLAQYAAGNLAVADLTTTNTPGQPGYGVPNGVITSDDFFYYLDSFATGC